MYCKPTTKDFTTLNALLCLIVQMKKRYLLAPLICSLKFICLPTKLSFRYFCDLFLVLGLVFVEVVVAGFEEFDFFVGVPAIHPYWARETPAFEEVVETCFEAF